MAAACSPQPPALVLLLHLSEALALGCELWRGWGMCPMGADITRWFWVLGPKVLKEELATGKLL